MKRLSNVQLSIGTVVARAVVAWAVVPPIGDSFVARWIVLIYYTNFAFYLIWIQLRMAELWAVVFWGSCHLGSCLPNKVSIIHPWDTLKTPLSQPWSTPEAVLVHPWNIQFFQKMETDRQKDRQTVRQTDRQTWAAHRVASQLKITHTISGKMQKWEWL